MMTNNHFWDCECKKDYIHYKHQHYCIKCDTWKEDQPDSMRVEVNQQFKETRQLDVFCHFIIWHTHYPKYESYWISDKQGHELESFNSYPEAIIWVKQATKNRIE